MQEVLSTRTVHSFGSAFAMQMPNSNKPFPQVKEVPVGLLLNQENAVLCSSKAAALNKKRE